MATPGFNEEHYLSQKLDSLTSQGATQSDGTAFTTTAQVKAAIEAAGLTAESHYEQFGFKEVIVADDGSTTRLTPNDNFVAEEYIAAKAAQLVESDSATYPTLDAAQEAFLAALDGGNVYTHYLQFGDTEGLNPSNSFDADQYFQDKLTALQADADSGFDSDSTVADVKAAFAEAGLSAIEHFELFGSDEGLTATAVATADEVEPLGALPAPEESEGVEGDTFTLTTATDQINGTADDDSVSGARIDDVQTLNSGDSIDLGAGDDSLTASLNAGTVAPTVTNVETLTFSALGAATVDMVNASGPTAIDSVGSTNTLNVDNIQSLADSVSVSNTTSAHTFVFKDDAVSGSSDALTVNLDSVGAVANIGSESDADGDIETLTINASGGNSDLVAGAGFGADATAITVNATADLDLGTGASFGKVTDFDASASTADVDAVIANRAAASDTAVSFATGKGDDVLDLGALVAANRGATTVALGEGDDTLDINSVRDRDSGSSYAGGAGADTLVIAGAALTADDKDQYTGFETLSIEANITQDADFFEGTTFATGNAGRTITISDLANNSVFNNTENSTSITLNRKTDTASDAVTVNLGGEDGGVTAAALVFDTAYENVTVNSQGDAANTLTAIATNVVNNMTFTGSTDLTVASTNNITGIVDFTEATGDITVTVTDTTSQGINFGAGDDTVTATGIIANGETQVINAGAGDDTINSGNLAAGATLTVNGEAGDDTISFNGANTGASVHNVNGGSGFDTITLGQAAATIDTVISTANDIADVDKISGFVTGTDFFDYNGSVKNDAATTVTAQSGTTLTEAFGLDPNATAYIVTTQLTGAAATDMTALVAETTAEGVATDYATFEESLVASLGTIADLDSTLDTDETVLLNVDDGTNSVILEVSNSDHSETNTLTADELELVGIMAGADDLVMADFA